MEEQKRGSVGQMREDHKIEYKRVWRDEYMKTICGFANTDGGTLYLGMSDEGIPVGLDNIERLLEDLPNKIRNRLGIIPIVKREVVGGKEIIRIEIPPSDDPIFYDGKFYIRSGSTTQEVKGSELIKIILRKRSISWDALLSDASIDDVDEETVDLFKELAKDKLAISERDSVEKILENLELMKDGKLTSAAVLLFGKNPQKYFPNSTSRVGRFKTSTEIIDTVEIKGNLFKQVEEMVAAIKKYINVKFEIKGVVREEVWDYPIPSIREACINALIHRDYMDPAEVQIKVYDDKIWFWNPGKLPEGITVDMLKRDHFSKPRNRLIATVFYYAGLIERWGTGTKRMVELFKERGLPEPEFEEFGDGFSVVFYKDIYNENHLRRFGLSERQIRAVLYVKKKGRITNKEYMNITSCSKITASRELSDLVEKGIMVKHGTTGKGTFYTLTSQTDQRDHKGFTNGSKGDNGNGR